MKAITIHQPWATLCVLTNPATGTPYKTIETRSWPCPASMIHRRLAIHSAAREAKPLPASAHPMMVGPSINGRQRQLWPDGLLGVESDIALPRGCVVGTVRVSACVPMVAWRAADNDVGREVNLGAGWIHPVIDVPQERRWNEARLKIDMDNAELELQMISRNGVALKGLCTDLSSDLPFGDFAPGMWAWILEKPVMLDEPIPVKGRQRVWNLPPELDHLAWKVDLP